MGVSITPANFYSQIPDLKALKSEDHWRKALTMTGVKGLDVAEQLSFLQSVCSPDLVNTNLKNIQRKGIDENGQGGEGYGFIEAQFLHCFIINIKPKKIIQVGCGVSTSIILNAAKLAGYSPEIICVEPYPSEYLIKLNQEKVIKLIDKKAQEVDVEVLTNLEKNDMLFIDSTHTVKPGSEVNKIILEILPKLGEEVWVHFHDIYFPYDYRRNLLIDDLYFWSESTLLHAFLINNSKFAVKLCQSLLHYKAPEEVKKILPDYDPQNNDDGLAKAGGKHFPASIYLKTSGNII